MMGRLETDREQLFYSYRLDELVPADHMVRKLDAVLDLSWLGAELAPYHSHTGPPSIDPEVMLRMLLVGYVFAIRSERLICSELQVNMAYRWFCGLSIESAIPDHSVFSRARHERFRESDALRLVFERVVAAGLVGGPCRRRGAFGRCQPDQGRCLALASAAGAPSDRPGSRGFFVR